MLVTPTSSRVRLTLLEEHLAWIEAYSKLDEASQQAVATRRSIPILFPVRPEVRYALVVPARGAPELARGVGQPGGRDVSKASVRWLLEAATWEKPETLERQ